MTATVRLVDGDAILALLEDDVPRSTGELAAACGTTVKAMSRRLSQLAQAGRVRRSNVSGRWCVRGWAAASAPTLRPAAVLQQLEFAPKS